MKLYNMDKQEWRGHFTKDDAWRSDVAYQCEICGTKTNQWFMAGYGCIGPRIICPADGTKNHAKIEKFLERLQDIEEKIKDYKKGQVADMLKEEKKIIEAKITKLSSRINAHDVVGNVKKIEKFYPVSRVIG